MEYIKKLIGLVAGVFCTLVVAWLCSYFFKTDFKWYCALEKPVFVPTGGWFTLAVTSVYAVNIAVVARLVTGKHFFPSMLFLSGIGLFSVCFVAAFFTGKNLPLAAFFAACVFALSFVQQVRFFLKELRIALYYFPAFLFNCYFFVVAVALALAN